MTHSPESHFPESGNIPQPSPSLMTPDSLAQIAQDLQRSVRPELIGIKAETEQLWRRMNILTGVMVAVGLILLGSSIWLTLRLLSLEQASPKTSINTELAETELLPRLETLEKDLKTLKQTDAPDLATAVENNEKQLQTVIWQVKRLTTDMQTLQDAVEIPEPSPRREPTVNEEPSPTPSLSPAPVLPTP